MAGVPKAWGEPGHSEEAKSVCRIWLAPVSCCDKGLLIWLSGELSSAFGLECAIAEEIDLPQGAYDARRDQYDASQVLLELERLKIERTAKVLGVTDVDLYAPGLNFVFGQAKPFGRECVVSLFRLRPEFYGMDQNRSLLEKRVLKEAVHELGHTFGLGHCGNKCCVMCFSNNILEVDRKASCFCSACLSTLLAALGRAKT